MLWEFILTSFLIMLAHGRVLQNDYRIDDTNVNMDTKYNGFRRAGNPFQPYYNRNRYNDAIESKVYGTYEDLSKRASSTVYAYRGYQCCCSYGMIKIRLALGDDPLEWDDTLAIHAEKRAVNMAKAEYGSDTSETSEGDCWWDSTYNNENQLKDLLSCSYPLWSWYSEHKDKNRNERGHFIKMVGEKVKKFGFGVAVNTNTKKIFYVARFDYNMDQTDINVIKYMEAKNKWDIPDRKRLHCDGNVHRVENR